MFIDLTKAFDCINHDLLISKLRKLGFSTSFMNLLISYLTDRVQCVEIDKIKSPFLKIKTGVFQGSKLASILFLIYVNFIFCVPTFGKLFLYADDIVIVYGTSDTNELKRQMEHDLKILKIFFDNHFLKMNGKKTKYLIFNEKAHLQSFTLPNMQITIENEVIERVSHFSYLGLIIDEELKFNKHVDFVKSKVLPMTFAIKRIRHLINQKTANQIYFAHINSHLLYMNPIWNVAKNSIIETLAVAQRKCLRIILNKYSFSPNIELYSEKFLPLKVMNEYNLLVLAFKIHHNLIRNNVETPRISEVHNYGTRQRDHFYVQATATRFGLSNFFKRGLTAFNNLENRIKRIHNIGRFKRELKQFLLNKFSRD